MTQTALAAVDGQRRQISLGLDRDQRKRFGQFMAPMGVARMLAHHFDMPSEVRLLDAGAGMGALTAAFVETACACATPPRLIDVTCYEVDATMIAILRTTLAQCAIDCARAGIAFRSTVIHDDYILRSAEPPDTAGRRYNCAILNPPYGKIGAGSQWRKALRSQGIETVNLYAAFVALALQQLELGGQLVAITPRSFCNGLYYEPFRRLVLDFAAFEAIHVFESRRAAFRDDDVLQENVIVRLRRGGRPGAVALSTDRMAVKRVPFRDIVHEGDRHAFIRLPLRDGTSADRIQSLPCTLGDLGLSVSTGRVMDYRARPYLRQDPRPGTVPLIYPAHFAGDRVRWPRDAFKRHNALADCEKTTGLIVPGGTYVLTKRFTAKEERRRIVAALYRGGRAAFENHLNYFHRSGAGLPDRLATGLTRYLNSSVVDTYFRTFSGHTQVNATDLRNLRYPTQGQLEALAIADDAEASLAAL